ncbi:intraflagellar transport protein 80 homolog [Condylostylus longicornis]|uniref:intraflagellar transport protein 80 homolog n=1 Tax=Condylostylus longicornis TaxID=2530218 RepID=UPI00244DD141|nr:intraflagellar transport protein 80 homolog [Condylostylus longicornis]
MKIKAYLNKNQFHKAPLSCLDWSNNEEIYSVSDDHQICKWSSVLRENVEIAKLPEDFIPTDLHWTVSKSGGKGGGDSLLISSNDGRFIILNKSARLERSIAAHTMSITSGRWSPDGASLLTASEDGIIKIWSRSGMLRSTVIQSDESIRCARWSGNSQSIAFCQNGYILVKSLAANSKLTKWRAHDGLILSLSWSPTLNLIASSGEDLRYKIWDQQGVNIYISQTSDYVITSVEFSPNQDLLAVGGFNVLKLCSSNGWSYNNCRFNSPPLGSIYNIIWSPDGTQVATGSSSGNLVFGHLFDHQLYSKNLKVKTTGRKSIFLKDIVSGSTDVLDFPDRIINLALNYGHLVVATPNQIHIFNENYINTPIIVDGRSDTKILELGKKFFLAVDFSSIWIYSYTGRLHLNPRFPGSQAQIQNVIKRLISIGLDVLAVRDSSDTSVIYIFDLMPGASRQVEPLAINTKTHVLEVATCRSGAPEDQYLVYIDVNRELFIISTKGGNDETPQKIGTQVMSVMWGSATNILVGLHDNCYSIWYCPKESSNDQILLALTTITHESSEFGKNVALESFESAVITFCSSGALFTINVNIYCEIMHHCLIAGQWQKALNICRIAQSTVLWATLAAYASKHNQLEIGEEAYSAALQIDKVDYLQYIRSLPPGGPEQMAENSLMLGRLIEAETILIHNKKVKEAIALCIRMHNWRRALDIAEKSQINLDVVLIERAKYLQALGKEEFDTRFLKIEK